MEKNSKDPVKSPRKKVRSNQEKPKKDKFKSQSNSLDNYFEKNEPETSTIPLNEASPNISSKISDKSKKTSNRTKKTQKCTNTLEKYVKFDKPSTKNEDVDENEFSSQENAIHNSSLIKKDSSKNDKVKLSSEENKMRTSVKEIRKNEKSKREPKKEPLNNNLEAENKNNVKLKRKNKGGIRIPTAAEIQKERDDIERCLKMIKEVESIKQTPTEELFKVDDSSDEEIELIDCKHLTIPQLDLYYNKYKQLMEDIINGTEKSDRHNRYYDNKYDKRSITFNFSTYVFDFTQLHHLLNLMEKELSSKDETYIFHVLLPEICLKIFMDEHEMSKEAATVYLNKRPIV